MSPLELIQNAKNIELMMSEKAGQQSLGDALCLLSALTQKGKLVTLSPEFLKPSYAQWIQPSSFPVETATILLKGFAPNVSMVSYEKDNQDIKLSFSLSQGTLKPEHIQMEHRPLPDLTIIVGANPVPYNQEITTNPHPRLWNSQKGLEAALSLLSPFKIPSLRLLCRSFSRLQYIKDKEVCFVPFERKDFRETQTNPKDIASIMSHLIAWAKPHISFVSVFEGTPGNKVQGIAKSTNDIFRKKLKGKEKGAWALFELPEYTVAAVKEKMSFLL